MRTLALERDFGFRTGKVSRSNTVVFKDVQALAGFTATVAFANGTVVRNRWRMFAIISADM